MPKAKKPRRAKGLPEGTEAGGSKDDRDQENATKREKARPS